tara:strand:- start:204 stop:464 length:261 start_codon:yes stop_codon:yes gene_type:complete
MMNILANVLRKKINPKNNNKYSPKNILLMFNFSKIKENLESFISVDSDKKLRISRTKVKTKISKIEDMNNKIESKKYDLFCSVFRR